MKFLRLLLILLASGVLFSSCQKELTGETGIATGTLVKDAAGDCTALVSGAYKKDTTLNASNYVDIQVNITEIGTYTITTDTLNGYYFRAEGAVALTGLNSIRLIGVGKPLAAGTDVFTVKFAGTICDINVNVTSNGGGITASVFTLGSTAGACTSNPSGTYAQNLVTSAANTVSVAVSVQTAGSYTISTPVVNGVSFSGSGNLTTSSTSILLTANGGLPTAAGSFNYPLTIGTSTCSFSIVYTAPLAAAVFTFNCASATVQGSYTAGTVLTNANTITVPVIVTTSGSYSITTGVAQNNISFSGSGTLTASASPQNIILTATPTIPTSAGTIAYNLTGNGTSCNPVNVVYTAATGGGTDYIRASIDGGPVLDFSVNMVHSYDFTSNAFAILYFYGYNAGLTESVAIDMASITTPTPGILPVTTYSVNNATQYITCTYYANSTFYEEKTDGATHVAPALNIILTTSTPTRATGTFSGRLVDHFGTAVKLITGSFSVPIN
jgi:hypothetical protein